MNHSLMASDIAEEATAIDSLSRVLKAAGDTLRLEILRLLARDSFSVMELSQLLDIKQSGMSHHLKVLTNVGLLTSRREGNSIFYRRNLASREGLPAALLEELFHLIDRTPLNDTIQQRLGEVQKERQLMAQKFFSENLHRFRDQQDLIASYPVYADAVQELLNHTKLAATTQALELGPGEGEFLDVLSGTFQQVIALDISSEMLGKARELAQSRQLGNIEFVHGDAEQALANSLQSDCIVVNMVFHHLPSPASTMDVLARLLTPGGALLITDLCLHDQQWARESCGDLWLGFEPEDLSNWARLAGLEEGQSQYLGLRNGFQVQLRQFFKPINQQH